MTKMMKAQIKVPEINLEELPEDTAVLQAMVMDLLQSMSRKDVLIDNLQHQLNQLLRHRFGQRSDRVDEAQLALFYEELKKSEAAAENAKDPEPEKASQKSSGKKHGRKPLPAELPRVIIEHDVPESEKTCKKCQSEKVVIRKEMMEQLEYVPASLKVLQHVQPIYACPQGCEGEVVKATKPMQPIEKGLPGPGLLAHVVTSKYADHLPLNRQEGILKRHGVEISKQTQCDWVMEAANLVTPLVDLMKREVLASKVIHTDDTPVDVQDRELTKTRQSRIWVYLGDEDHLYTVFDYTRSRKRDGPERFLNGFEGYLQADAYGGYDRIYVKKGVTEVACWAHVRRKFVEAEDTCPDIARAAIARIRLIYDVEDEANEYLAGLPEDMDPKAKRESYVAKRYALRQEKSKPRIEEIAKWLRQQSKLRKSPIGQAIAYTLNNLDALKVYLEDGDLEIDNNAAERAIRGLCIGRNNWTFFGSDRGGKTAAILYSLVQTCKSHQIDPFEYLRDVFTRISSHPVNKLHEFLPDRWKALRDQAKQIQSDLVPSA
jgi:transposase